MLRTQRAVRFVYAHLNLNGVKREFPWYQSVTGIYSNLIYLSNIMHAASMFNKNDLEKMYQKYEL